MQADDRPEFVRVLNGMATIKGRELTEEAYKLWWHAMADWDVGDFRDAAGYLLKNCQFMPAPNDFEALLKKQRNSAHEGWAEALCHASGAWRYGSHEDGLIERVVSALGGWSLIALCDNEKLAFMERRFLSIYEDFVDGDEVRAALPNLTENTTVRIGKAVPLAQIAESVVKSP